MRLLIALLDHTPRFAAAPAPFGAFHLISLGLVLGLFIAMIVARRHLSRGERALRRVLGLFGVGLLFLEIGKQIVYSYAGGGAWAYAWDRFPFQFCSLPIYVALLALCLRPGRVRTALLAFLAAYGPVAGFAVLLWPAGWVFHEIIFLNVHTMLWHGAMVLFGLYLWLTEAVVPSPRAARQAFFVFLPTPVMALLLNEAEYLWNFAGDADFNMFYISRHGTCSIPVLGDLQAAGPYPLFFVAYMLVLGLGGVLVVAGVGVVRRLWRGRVGRS